MAKIKKLEEGRHKATMAQNEREKVREKEKSKVVLKSWALKTENGGKLNSPLNKAPI